MLAFTSLDFVYALDFTDCTCWLLTGSRALGDRYRIDADCFCGKT